MNGIYYCHDDEGVVFRVKGSYLKIEQSKKIVKKWLKKQKKWESYLLLPWWWRGCVQGSGSISKNRIKVENCETYLENQKKMRMIFTVAMMCYVQGSGSTSNYRKQQKMKKKGEKIINGVTLAIISEGLCSRSVVYFKIWKSA